METTEDINFIIQEIVAGLVTISVNDIVVSEADTFATFTVSLSSPSDEIVSVDFNTFFETAGSNDFESQSTTTLIFSQGQTTQTVNITLDEDTIDENPEVFGLNLSSPSNAILADEFAFATIIDNDSPLFGTANIFVEDIIVDETDGQAFFTITLDRGINAPVIVNYTTVNGTGIAGEDYIPTNGSIVFEPNQTAQTVAVDLIDDSIFEGVETFDLVLSAPTNANILDGRAIASIGANDQIGGGLVGISVNDIVVSEADTFATFTVSLSSPSDQIVTVDYNTFFETAGSNDIESLSSTLIFTPGQTTQTVNIILNEDTIDENPEVFGLNLSSPSNAILLDQFVFATIIDNDSPLFGTANISVADIIIDETEGQAFFTITLDRSVNTPVTVNYTTANDTAIAGQDYISANGTILFEPNQTAQTIAIDLVNDSISEGVETFDLVLSAPTNANILDERGIATIGANDQLGGGLVGISINDIVVSEADTFATFTVSLNSPSDQIVTVDYNTFFETAGGNDFESQFTTTLIFIPGQTTETVNIALNEDTISENPEVFGLNIFSPSNGILLDEFAFATIVDNDSPLFGTGNISVGDIIVDETDGQAFFTITLDRAINTPVTVNYTTANSTAIAGQDYISANGTILFEPNQTAQTVAVDLINDTLSEGVETFDLVLSAPTNANILDERGIATIGANDQPGGGLVGISINDIVVSEADTFATFTVSLNSPSDQIVTVDYNTFFETAGTNDFESQFTTTLIFTPGQTTETVNIALNEDTIDENPEVFGLNLFSPSNAILLDDFAFATIIDNDSALFGTANISVEDIIVDETDGQAFFTITLDRSVNTPVTVNYTTGNETAIAGQDYISANGTILFEPNQTAQTVAVDLINDSIFEGVETFDLHLSGATNANILDARGIATIGANDQPGGGSVEISVDDILVNENEVFATFTVSLSSPSDQIVTVDYNTFFDTAGTNDFESQFTTTLIFSPGQTTETINIVLNQDNIAEDDEVFGLNLFSPSNAILANELALATITEAIIEENDPEKDLGFVLDIDGNGTVAPLSDGLLIIRHLFGFTGDSLINNAVDDDATRTTAEEIESFLELGENTGLLDIDGNGSADPLSDGLLIIRDLFGFTGDALINNAVAPNAIRNTSDAIEDFIDSLLPDVVNI